MEIDYPVTLPSYQQTQVMWSNIDPRTWPSGYYIMGVIVGDIYGNEGFAKVLSDAGINPWFVNIQTAY